MKINVLGIGNMGSQIATLLALQGNEVTAWNRADLEAKKKKCARTRRLFGRKIPDQGGEIHFTDDLSALPTSLTLEVLEEDLTIKRDVVGKLPYDPATHGILTNTSSYRPEEIHPAAGGLHFFNPIQMLRLIEYLAPPTPTVEEEALLAQLDDNDFVRVDVRPNRGYIGNFLLFAEIAASLKLIDDYGYDSKDIDRVMTSLGRETSIFSIIDLIGIDVTKRILDNLHEQDACIHVSPLLDRAMAQNILGRKNGTSILEILHDA